MCHTCHLTPESILKKQPRKQHLVSSIDKFSEDQYKCIMISGFNAVEPTTFNTVLLILTETLDFCLVQNNGYSGIHQKPTANLIADAASAAAYGARSPSFCATLIKDWIWC
ncbi:hypothetical protein T09_4332 [Trichinella sp. T9]|nr:hypothetical protein T09_4332 [Trichinella sp. T9]